MKNQDFIETLAALGITQMGAARVLGRNPATIRRWVSGGLKIPREVELLLESWRQHGVPDHLRQMAGDQRKKMSGEDFLP